jgi:hypothetical protein
LQSFLAKILGPTTFCQWVKETVKDDRELYICAHQQYEADIPVLQNAGTHESGFLTPAMLERKLQKNIRSGMLTQTLAERAIGTRIAHALFHVRAEFIKLDAPLGLSTQHHIREHSLVGRSRSIKPRDTARILLPMIRDGVPG